MTLGFPSISCLKFSCRFLVVVSLLGVARLEKDADMPALFIFGDSLVDVGTNKYIGSFALADFPYNGIDFPRSDPTGRFSNGYNVADEIARLLGYKQSPQPYYFFIDDLSTSKKNILKGVNFASGGSGILRDTGFQQFMRVIPMAEQVEQFRLVRNNITKALGPKATSNLLSRSLFIISVGSNDLDEYYHSNKATSQQEFMKSIQSNFTAQLRDLYKMGARKFGIIGIPAIGCMPLTRVLANLTKPGSGCEKELNRYVREFHTMVSGLLLELRTDLKGMMYSLGDAYNMTITLMENPPAYGFTNVEEACCGLGQLNGEKPCLIFQMPLPNLCKNRTAYLFWDFHHPTEHACRIAAKTLFEAGTEYTTPISFRQLVDADMRDQ